MAPAFPAKVLAVQGAAPSVRAGSVAHHLRGPDARRHVRSGARSGAEPEHSPVGGLSRCWDCFGGSRFAANAMPLAPSYDVVIIGGGAHGLATAYELAPSTGSGTSPCSRRATSAPAASGRNTTILRANYKTPERHRVLQREPQAATGSSRRSSTSTCCSRTHGLLWLGPLRAPAPAISASARMPNQALRRRHRVFLDAAAGRRAVPAARHDGAAASRPILGAAYHPPGAIIRHDAVVWGYARRGATARRAHPPGRRGHRASRSRTAAASGSRPTRPDRRRHGDVARSAGYVTADRPTWPASGCRS